MSYMSINDGYIYNELYKETLRKVLNAIDATKGIKDTKFDDNVIPAVPRRCMSPHQI